ASALLNGKSRVSREAQARFREGLGVQLPGATRPTTEGDIDKCSATYRDQSGHGVGWFSSNTRPLSRLPGAWEHCEDFGDLAHRCRKHANDESGSYTISRGLVRRDRIDYFIRGHDSTGVVRDIDVERCVHLFIRVIRGRVFYHRDLVAELSGKANRRFDAGMCYESDDDELMDAVLFELQIQICVGETTGTPMLRDNNFA